MKDNSLDGHRGKVALSDITRNATTTSSSSNNNSSSVVVKCELKSPPQASTTSTANDGSAATNFDDDYNEWELGIGDLIIDLDADIEKTNERNGISSQQHHNTHHSQQNGTAVPSPSSVVNDSPTSATTFNFLGSQTPCNNSNLAAAMSNSKTPRLSGNSGVSAGATSSTGTGVTTTGSSNSGASVQGSGTFEHQATVDKGLKMKIKRKTVGSKYSEAKHEIVQSDTKSSGASSHQHSENSNSNNNSNNCASNSSSNSPANCSEAPKSKHSSSKGRTSSHREKKEKNRDKEKSTSARSNTTSSTSSTEMNGVLGVMSPLKITSSGVSLSSPVPPPPLCSNSSPLPSSTVVNTSVSTVTSVATSPANTNGGQDTVQTNSGNSLMSIPIPAVPTNSPPMPNLTLKLDTKFSPSPISQPCTGAAVGIKQEEEPLSPPQKKIKLENPERNGEVSVDSFFKILLQFLFNYPSIVNLKYIAYLVITICNFVQNL